MPLREAHVDLFGNPRQAGAGEDAGQIQQHFRGLCVVFGLPAEQLGHVGDFRVVKQQQRFTGNAITDKTLAHRAQALTAHGIGEGHVQLADFEDVHLRHWQLDEHVQHFGQQGGGTAHGDVGDLAQGVAEVDLEFIQYGGLGQCGGGGLGVEEAQFQQGAAQGIGVGRFFDESQCPQLFDAANGFILHVARHHHHFAGQALGTHGRECFVAVQHRHGQVQQHHLAQALTQGGQCLLTIRCLADSHRPFGRQGADQLLARHIRVVTDH